MMRMLHLKLKNVNLSGGPANATLEALPPKGQMMSQLHLSCTPKAMSCLF